MIRFTSMLKSLYRGFRSLAHNGKRKLASYFCIVRAFAEFSGGYITFLRTQQTPETSLFALRQLYCLTNGRLNDAIARCSSIAHPPITIPEPSGLLGRLDESTLPDAVTSLRTSGYYVFKHRMPPEMCERLRQFALHTPSTPYPPPNGESSRAIFSPSHPIAPLYKFLEGEYLLENVDIQNTVTDPSILAVAQSYLRCAPVCDSVMMWWSTPYMREASSDAAQLYHFDMARIKFVKFFVYLTDVGPDNGPHCYVAGSHIRKPRGVLRDGRISDDELAKHFPAESFVEILGPPGTILAVDTRGFHKGKPVTGQSRLIFEIQFGNSLYGAPFVTYHRREVFGDTFLRVADRHKYTFSRFLGDSKRPNGRRAQTTESQGQAMSSHM